MKNVILFFALLFVLFFSCKEERSSNDSVKIPVDLQQRDRFSLAATFSKIEIIPLETCEESLFHDIQYLKFVNGRYYILDVKSKVLLIFDSRGKFIFKIDRVGEGPGEYLTISDFSVNPGQNRIELVEPILSALYQYDMEGDFIQAVPLPKITGAYEKVYELNDDTLVFFTHDYKNRIKYYSRKEREIVYETYPDTDLDRFCTFDFMGEDLFCRSLTNKVYRVTCEGLVSAYEWDFGTYNNDLSNLERPMNPEKGHKFNLGILNSELVSYALGVQASCQSFHYAKLIRNFKFLHVLYNTKTQKTWVFDKTVEGLDWHPIEITDKYVLGIHAPGEMDKVISPEILSEEEQIKLKAIAPDDNPALIKYYF